MYNDDKTRLRGWIFFFFIPFFPLLFLWRIFLHRNLSFQKTKDWKLLGNSIFVFFVYMMIYSISRLGTEFRMGHVFAISVVLLIPALICWTIGNRKVRKLEERYGRYQAFVFGSSSRSVNEIAQHMGLRTKLALNDLRRMQLLGLLPGYAVLSESMTVVKVTPGFDSVLGVNFNFGDLSGSLTQAVNAVASYFSPQEETPALQPLVVECPGCGYGTLLQPNESKSCPYCGSAVTYAQAKKNA
ncbi:hypothetical protein [Gorillibacterium timonense]|uniref:hypothetical protein n=1 Tax=Gorillibacterium timonense TaxID=1689269 RepID=UPI00071CDF8E|nr:hypothetical protein [Gorillibacterium timonense]